MRGVFDQIAGSIALGLDAAGTLLIAVGAIKALILSLGPIVTRRQVPGARRAARIEFGVWLLLGLEFQLGADIVSTGISPTWVAIGQLGAIAVIRTFLNYFLERDIGLAGDPS